MIRALGEFSNRLQFAGVAGLTFKGARDLYNALGYTRTLTLKDYRDRFKRGGIAARIVEAFPDATWSGGAEIVEDEDPEISTALEDDFEDLDERLGVWEVFHRADILAGIGTFSVIVIGAAGKLDEELPMMGSQEDILYLSVYAPDEVTIQTWDIDPESERFGLPLTYQIQRKVNNVQTMQNFSRMVHWTRIIHVADGVLEDTITGTPRLEKVWNDLDNLDKVVGGGSEAFWLRVHQGYHWDIDPNIKVDDAVKTKLEQEAEEFAHQMRRTMATRGMKFTTTGSDVANFDPPVKALMSLISGATKIPQRILLGSERGELASTQDRENWNDRVVARRGGYATNLVRDLVGRLMDYGALPEAEEYDVRWPDIKVLTEGEQADVATKWAGLNKAADGPVVLPEEIRDRILGLDPLTPEQVEEWEGKKPAPPAIGPDGKPMPPGIGPDGKPLPPGTGPDGQPLPPAQKNEPPTPVFDDETKQDESLDLPLDDDGEDDEEDDEE